MYLIRPPYIADPISIASVSSGMQCIAIIIPCMDVYNCHYGNIKD
jgi:hypothetical protein